MGSTAKEMEYQQYNIKPDIVTLAKALGGGFPIGALLADSEVAGGFVPGDHASTFGGNPLACAVGLKMMEIIFAPSFLEQVLVDICLKNGLLLISAGPRVLRLVPPLNITRGEVEEAVGILEQSLQEWDP